MFIGLIGIVAPFVPGVILVWLGLLVYAWGTGFIEISIAAVIIFFFLTLFSISLDLIAQMVGARTYKASKYGLAGVFIGFIAGILLFNIWGIILGPLVGAFLGELAAGKQPGQAARTALGTAVGAVVGILLKFIIALIMIGYFIISLVS